MCKCSELDWSGVDQTAEHHPECGTTTIVPLFGDVHYFGKITIDANRNITRSAQLHDWKNSECKYLLHVGGGVVEMVSDEDMHTKEACENRIPDLVPAQNEFDQMILSFIERNPEAFAGAVARCIREGKAAGILLRNEFNKAR